MPSIPWPASKPTTDLEKAINSSDKEFRKPVDSSVLTDSAALEEELIYCFAFDFVLLVRDGFNRWSKLC